MLFHADSPLLFDEIPCVYLSKDNGPRGEKPRRFTVRSWRAHKDRILLRLNELDGRDQIEPWRGAEVLALKKDLPEPGPDEVYLHELIGITTFLENGEKLGVVRDFLETPGQETWVIETPEGKEILLPVVEEFVVAVDLVRNAATVAPPEGLLDLYLSPEPARSDEEGQEGAVRDESGAKRPGRPRRAKRPGRSPRKRSQ